MNEGDFYHYDANKEDIIRRHRKKLFQEVGIYCFSCVLTSSAKNCALVFYNTKQKSEHFSLLCRKQQYDLLVHSLVTKLHQRKNWLWYIWIILTSDHDIMWLFLKATQLHPIVTELIFCTVERTKIFQLEHQLYSLIPKPLNCLDRSNHLRKYNESSCEIDGLCF